MSMLKISILLVFSTFIQTSISYSKLNVDVCSSWSENWKSNPELKTKLFTDVRLVGGSSAGKFAKVKVNNWYECVSQCCAFSRCNVAFWVSATCLHIECISDDLCQPTPIEDTQKGDQTLFVQVRPVRNTAAAIDYEDPGQDECNQTKSCPTNEVCQQVSINADLKRYVCLCDRENGFRRINGACREYVSHSRPCSLYERITETNDESATDDNNRGACRKNEECLPPNDRARHGYCQCKLGYLRSSETGKCVATDISSTSATKTVDIQVDAGEDQNLISPMSQADLIGRVLFQSNKTIIDASILANHSWRLIWSLKASDEDEQVELIKDQSSPFHVTVKNLKTGTYEFELQLIDEQGSKIAVDQIQIQVSPEKTTAPPLLIRLQPIVKVTLPKQSISIQASVEPSDRTVSYHWTYMKDGPSQPALENIETAELSISNLRPGNYSFSVSVTDNLGHEQNKIVRVVAVGIPIIARVSNAREIVFWPSNDVLLDGMPSIIEPGTRIVWSLLSTDNQRAADEIEIQSPHSLKTRVLHLKIGQYRFQLELTTGDEQFISKIEVLVIVYSQNGRPPKIRIQLETPNVNIYNNLLILNASGTTADYGIQRWKWTKSSSSPALGNFLNGSDLTSIAYLTNLIEGQYVLNLQVIDDRQQMSESNISVQVSGFPEAENLIEIRFSSKTYLYQQSLDNLIVQIRVFLIDLFPNVYIEKVAVQNSNALLIKAIDKKTNAILPPKIIAEHLRSKLKPLRAASNINIISAETFLCLSNCSNHGRCDHSTKRCVCNRYYMENWFRSIVYREPNCDFMIHYFLLFLVTGLILFIGLCCCCLCCCLRWRRRQYLMERRKRIRYQLLHENDDYDDEDVSQLSNQSPIKHINQALRSKKNGKGKQSTMVVSESDNDLSDTNGEQTLYDKPLLAAKYNSNLSSTKSRGFRVPVQDSTDSPKIRKPGQTTPINDSSVA